MTTACHLIKKHMSQITVGKYSVYTETTKSMAWFWTDFVLQATLTNLNGAKPVISKFNNVELKVKYNHIKYTCYKIMYVTCNLQDAFPLWTGILVFADELYQWSRQWVRRLQCRLWLGDLMYALVNL